MIGDFMKNWNVSLSVDGAEILNISDDGIGGHEDIFKYEAYIREAVESLNSFITISDFYKTESET
jgi:hypothetical protein